MTTTAEQVFTFDMLAGYPDGPWTGEPDKVVWVDEATDLDCMAKRSPTSRSWCGYVGVPEGHPWFGVDYQELEDNIDVHGRLTYAAACQEGAGDRGICHTPQPGRSGHIWWIGFDCGHAWDVTPYIVKVEREDPRCPKLSEFEGMSYKPLGYVKAEVLRLAAQAAAASK